MECDGGAWVCPPSPCPCSRGGGGKVREGVCLGVVVCTCVSIYPPLPAPAAEVREGNGVCSGVVAYVRVYHPSLLESVGSE